MVLRTELLGLDMREMLDVAYVRRQKNSAHVSDEDALTAFCDGRGVFDVDLHCRKLDALWLSTSSKLIFTVKTFCPVPTPR